MAGLIPQPRYRALDSAGSPLSGGKLYFYDAGTDTPRDTYTDSSRATTNTNPVVLDSEGYADIWGEGSYKVVVTDSNDVQISTTDNIDVGGASTSLSEGGTGSSLSDPGSDRLMFWDNSAKQVNWLRLSDGLSIDGDVLTGTFDPLQIALISQEY